MKRLTFTTLCAAVVAIFALSSCNKESVAPTAPGAGLTGPTSTQALNSIDLVADNWVNYGDEVYVDKFSNALAALYPPDGRRITVYLVTTEKNVVISQQPILFMGHPLSAFASGNDLSIRYQCGSASLPFNSLHIRVTAN